MTDHDPLCEDKDGPRYGQYCDCRLIDKVRADEREQIALALGPMEPEVWIVFLGEYSDRREVAAFDNEQAALTAAEQLWQPDERGRREGVDVDRLPLQTAGSGASLDGGKCVWSDGRRYAPRAGSA